MDGRATGKGPDIIAVDQNTGKLIIVEAKGTSNGRTKLGNFWLDVTRGTVRILLPISVVVAIVFVAFGVIQSLKAGVAVTNPDEGHSRAE